MGIDTAVRAFQSCIGHMTETVIDIYGRSLGQKIIQTGGYGIGKEKSSVLIFRPDGYVVWSGCALKIWINAVGQRIKIFESNPYSELHFRFRLNNRVDLRFANGNQDAPVIFEDRQICFEVIGKMPDQKDRLVFPFRDGINAISYG